MVLPKNVQSDRRSGKRYPYPPEPICFIDGPDGGTRPACVIDVSQGGMKLMMSRPLPEQMLTYLELPGKGRRRTRLFQVRHVYRDIDGWCKLGGAFVPPLVDRDLRYVLRSG